jgi:hypothetical protein
MSTPVVLNLAAADLERERPNLERGSVVAAGVTGIPVGSFCDVELVFPSGERMTFAARAVLATGGNTIFAFDGFDRGALLRHLAAPIAPAAASASAEPDPFAGPGDAGGDEADEADEEDEEDEEAAARSATVQERLRGIPVAEQLRVAREGSLAERVALERLYGKMVWEALLRNTRVTVPEVSRLAKMGTMPRPLLEIIVGNAAWLQVPQIRRALLSNPRLSQEMVQKVLSLLPRDELKLVTQGSAYPPAVRMAAKAMVRR